MNWSQFKDPVSHICLVDAVVTFWSLTQEVAGSNNFLLLNLLNSVKTFKENTNRDFLIHYIFIELLFG